MGLCRQTWNLGESIRDLSLELAIRGVTKIHLEASSYRTFLGLNCAPGLDGRARFGLGRKPRETRRQRQGPGTSLTGMDITMVCLILPRTGESWTSKRSASCLTALCSHDSECLGGVRHFMWGDMGAAKVRLCQNFLGLLLGCRVPSIPKQSVRNRNNRGRELRSWIHVFGSVMQLRYLMNKLVKR